MIPLTETQLKSEVTTGGKLVRGGGLGTRKAGQQPRGTTFATLFLTFLKHKMIDAHGNTNKEYKVNNKIPPPLTHSFLPTHPPEVPTRGVSYIRWCFLPETPDVP